MLNFQWSVWESESDNTTFNTPANPSTPKKKIEIILQKYWYFYISLIDISLHKIIISIQYPHEYPHPWSDEH